MGETKYLSISHPWNNWSQPRLQFIRLRLCPVRVSGHGAGAVGPVTLPGGAWESDDRQCQEEYHKLAHSGAQFSGMAWYVGASREIHRLCLPPQKKEGRRTHVRFPGYGDDPVFDTSNTLPVGWDDCTFVVQNAAALVYDKLSALHTLSTWYKSKPFLV